MSARCLFPLLAACLPFLLPSLTWAADPAETAGVERLRKTDASFTTDSSGSVVKVQFGCGACVHDEDLILLRAFPKLNRLAMAGKDDISDSGVANLKGLKVKFLMIYSTILTPEAAKHIATLTDLEILDIKGAPVSGEWLVHLKKSPNLHTLRLRDSELTDADAKHFAGFPKLSELKIGSKKMTTTGVDAVRVALPNAKVTP